MIILASASPRRQELLTQIKCDYRIVVSNAIEDDRQNIPPESLVIHNAILKAKAVAQGQPENTVVLGADTVVFMNGRIYGKPSCREEAISMLSDLVGKSHEVYTGIALVRGDKIYSDFEKTIVTLMKLSTEEIEAYVDTKEPMDKAGAYAIQGIASVYIEKIEGCYTNVVGLPLNKLLKLSRKAGIDL